MARKRKRNPSGFTSRWATGPQGGAVKMWSYRGGPARTTQAEARKAWQNSDRTKKRRARAPRKRNSSSDPVTKLTLFHNKDWGEWIVKAWRGRKWDENASYFTHDKQDAIDTMKDMARRRGLPAPRTKNFADGMRYIRYMPPATRGRSEPRWPLAGRTRNSAMDWISEGSEPLALIDDARRRKRRRKTKRKKNMRVSPRMYMGKTPLRKSLYGFKVTASRDDVYAFAQSWPGSGMSSKRGFAAEFSANGDLVDLEGWPSTDEVDDVDQSALSAFIDDMKAWGLKRADQ